jgi:hypothetical protein
MHQPAQELLQTHLDDAHLALFISRLHAWLIGDMSEGGGQTTDFPESRAKALLRITESIDDATLNGFARLMAGGAEATGLATRLALYDLLADSGLAENGEVMAIAAATGQADPAGRQGAASWLSLAVAAFAWRNGYPLHQLDPATPPETFSPAGQLVKQTGSFVRQQMLRSATERERSGRLLAYRPDARLSSAPPLDDLRPLESVAPLPPHYRPPVPVRYPEVARETLHLEGDENAGETPVVSVTGEIKITEEDLLREERPQRMPPIRVSADQLRRSDPARSRTVTPRADPPPLTSFSRAVRERFGRGREPFATTKLQVVVQEYPDGPGMYGLQVRVTCQGVRSYVAGATNRDGKFLCELPVRSGSGLTYDVDVTWPRDLGGDIERKSMTLNADRTRFQLPFYRRIQQDGG